MFRKKNKTPKTKSGIERRVARLNEDDLLIWGDKCIDVVSRSLHSYSRYGGVAYLEEAKLNAEALLAISTTLEERAKP